MTRLRMHAHGQFGLAIDSGARRHTRGSDRNMTRPRSAARERDAALRYPADAFLALEARWGTRADALKRLSEVSQNMARLRLEQESALLERDELIAQLREEGDS